MKLSEKCKKFNDDPEIKKLTQIPYWLLIEVGKLESQLKKAKDEGHALSYTAEHRLAEIERLQSQLMDRERKLEILHDSVSKVYEKAVKANPACACAKVNGYCSNILCSNYYPQ